MKQKVSYSWLVGNVPAFIILVLRRDKHSAIV